jgi:hypothetical protein
MSDCLPRIYVFDEWIDINTLFGIPTGTAMEVQVVGGSYIDAALSPAMPVGDIGEKLDLFTIYGVRPLENNLWLKACAKGTASKVSIHVDGEFIISGDYSPDYSTDYSQD